jgi:sulfur relay (sulfurtransferase) complex TusBCD TusD component (DsrE family)
MDAPYESESLTTAFRLLDAMARRGHNINVFAFEGASGLAFSKQAPHPNQVHGKNVAEENHPTTKDQVTALLASARLPSGVIATAETESAAVPRLDGSSHTAPECRCRLQVRTRLTAGATRIRTLGPSVGLKINPVQPGTRKEPQVTATPVIRLAHGRVPERSLLRHASYWPLQRQDCYRNRSLNQG